MSMRAEMRAELMLLLLLLSCACSPGDLADTANNAAAVSIGSLAFDGTTKLLTGTTYIVSVSGAPLTATGDGAAKMVKCPNNAWTKGLGATNIDECCE
jgi:hypothetical protein